MPTTVETWAPFVDDVLRGAADGRPEGAGAVAVAVARPGQETVQVHGGRTASFDAAGTPLDPEDPTALPVSPASLFDLASVTKVVTTLTAATVLDDGALDLDAPVREILGTDAVPDARITARHLLTHTAGLPASLLLWRLDGDRDARLDAIGHTALLAEPGTRHEYSCVGFLVLGRLLERISGEALPELARARVLEPAGARTATWWPDPAARAAAVATEHMTDPPRGLVRGEVHDETAWSIGGAGNAGLFASIEDALAIAGVLAGTGPGPALSPATRSLLLTDQLGEAPPTGQSWRQGLGLRIGQRLPDGRVLDHVAWHAGFTGTAIWADPRTGVSAALLTNRVHPRREVFGIAGTRERCAALAFDA